MTYMRYAANIPYSSSKEELREWCTNTFGPSTSLITSRWFMLDYTVQFKEEKDRNWFLIRWSS